MINVVVLGESSDKTWWCYVNQVINVVVLCESSDKRGGVMRIK